MTQNEFPPGFHFGGSKSLSGLNMSARIYGLPNFDWVSLLICSPSPSSQRTSKMITAPDWFRPNSIYVHHLGPLNLYGISGVQSVLLQAPTAPKNRPQRFCPTPRFHTSRRKPCSEWCMHLGKTEKTGSLVYLLQLTHCILYDSCITLYPLVN